jgi:integrase
MGRPRKCWTKRVGSHGHHVTAYERVADGPIWLRWWIPSTSTEPGRWQYRALKHTDRSAAEEIARTIVAQLLAATVAADSGRVTMAELFARYEREVSAHKKGTQPREDERRVKIWTHVLGATCLASALDTPTLDRFVRERRAGEISIDGIELAKKPSDAAIFADLVFLQSVLNWATRVRRSNGAQLLATNPIRGYQSPRNKNIKRPVATYDRYLAVRKHADAADPQQLFGSFLDLIEALGWRVSAVCALRGSDVDRAKVPPLAPNGRILKRSDVDKEGVQMWVPLSPDARAAIDRITELHVDAGRPAIGDVPLFPSPKEPKPGQPVKSWTRFHARDLLERTEDRAELEHLAGGDFHPYRRAWASARKHLPLTDVAHAGGWRDLRSLERCYTLPDEETTLAVVLESRKVRDVQVANDEKKSQQNEAAS